MTTFRVGLGAERAEFRSSDVNGRPIDVSREGDTARTERVLALQARWVPRELPPVEPREILAEWMTWPENRMSAFARNLAENPEMLPQAEAEAPGLAPKPGGLIEQMKQTRRGRGSVV